MSQEEYTGWSGNDRNEMFAIGAAAGALIATAIQEMLERRRKTPLEKARDQAVGIAGSSREYVREMSETAGDYVADLGKSGRRSWRGTKKAARKKAERSGEQLDELKKAATGALGAVATAGVVEKALDLVNGDRSSKRSGWLDKAGESAQSGLEAVRETIADVQPGRRARGWWNTVSGTAGEYAGTARERIEDAELGSKARLAAMTARERLEEAHLRERARHAAASASETLREAAETARERIEDAHLRDRAKEYAGVAGETVKDYSTKAGKVAKVSAVRLGEAAEDIAESTAEGARGVRKGVKKGVRRTRRRINWGLRAFIIGLAVGLLSAPQSGDRTRQSIQDFIESLLEIVMPDQQTGGSSI